MSLIDVTVAKEIASRYRPTQEEVDIAVTFLLQNGFTFPKTQAVGVRIVSDYRQGRQPGFAYIRDVRFKDPTTNNYVGYSKAIKRVAKAAKSKCETKKLATQALQKLNREDHAGCKEDLSQLIRLLGGNPDAL